METLRRVESMLYLQNAHHGLQLLVLNTVQLGEDVPDIFPVLGCRRCSASKRC
jgi:hypothetical protein